MCGSSSLTTRRLRAVLREAEQRAGERERRLIAGHPGQALTLPHRIRQLLTLR